MKVPIKKCDCGCHIVDFNFNHQALNFFSSACLEANFLMLRQGELMFTLRAFGITALHRGRAAGTGKGSTICYVKGKATFWTPNYSFGLRFHWEALSVNQTYIEILKLFLNHLVNAKILTIVKIILIA
jgi:hypothetical protein